MDSPRSQGEAHVNVKVLVLHVPRFPRASLCGSQSGEKQSHENQTSGLQTTALALHRAITFKFRRVAVLVAEVWVSP